MPPYLAIFTCLAFLCLTLAEAKIECLTAAATAPVPQATTTTLTSTESCTSKTVVDIVTITTTDRPGTSIVVVTSASQYSTVATPRGFLPVQDSLKGVTYDGAGGGSPVQNKRRDTEPVPQFDNFGEEEHFYKGDVTCSETLAATVCKQQFTTTLTSVVVPGGTTTTTSTETVLRARPSPVYAACAQNNFGDMFKGNDILEIVVSKDSKHKLHRTGYHNYYGTFDSAYDCCTASFQFHPHTEIWLFYPDNGQCLIGAANKHCINEPKHKHERFQAIYNATAPKKGERKFVFGNGGCGLVNKRAELALYLKRHHTTALPSSTPTAAV